MKEIIVSVVMITYGHEKYIQQAIEGIFIQQTNFLVEFIIANDCSPDNSDVIIKNAIENTPDNFIVHYTRHEKNLGMMPNFTWALKQAKGKYIALCEGDDYWIDPLKLQKQVDFLEANPDYVAVGCKRKIIDREGDFIDNSNEQLILFTNCIVFRNIVDEKYLKFTPVRKITCGDLFLFLYLESFGKIHIMDFTGSVYRISEDGIWTSLSILEKKKVTLQSLSVMINFFRKHNLNHSLSRAIEVKNFETYQYAMAITDKKLQSKVFKIYLKQVVSLVCRKPSYFRPYIIKRIVYFYLFRKEV